MENKDYTNMTEVDVAYRILNSAKEPMNYKALITEVIDKKNKPVQSVAAAISEIYTMINMDSRFQHRGKGFWGLTEWNPPEIKKTAARSTTTKTVSTKIDESKFKDSVFDNG